MPTTATSTIEKCNPGLNPDYCAAMITDDDVFKSIDFWIDKKCCVKARKKIDWEIYHIIINMENKITLI